MDQLDTALAAYPSDWVARSAASGPIRVKQRKRTRAKYSDHEPSMTVDPTGVLSDDTLHEMGHRFEHTIVEMRVAERGFYEERTKDSPQVTLKSLKPHSNYRRDEVTRPDLFPEPYMGKRYSFGDVGHQRNSNSYTSAEAYEVFTTGYPMVTGRSKLPKDVSDMLGVTDLSPRAENSPFSVESDEKIDLDWSKADAWPDHEAFILGMLAEI